MTTRRKGLATKLAEVVAMPEERATLMLDLIFGKVAVGGRPRIPGLIERELAKGNDVLMVGVREIQPDGVEGSNHPRANVEGKLGGAGIATMPVAACLSRSTPTSTNRLRRRPNEPREQERGRDRLLRPSRGGPAHFGRLGAGFRTGVGPV